MKKLTRKMKQEMETWIRIHPYKKWLMTISKEERKLYYIDYLIYTSEKKGV
jgi:hypothetical protein